MSLYPFLLNPALHVKVWGGRRLNSVLGIPLPSDEPYGESWECHDTALVANGPLAGRAIGELVREYGPALVGPHNNPTEGLPLLAKFLDAAEWLSVQVHPNDEQARELEGDPRGKTEAWYVLAVEPGAKLVKAVQPGTTREAMAQAIRENRLEDLLVYEVVQPGDVLLNLAGTIHALGPGIMIYEIQQSSDVTYRLYDWGRMDLNGKPRALHIEKGVAVSNVEVVPEVQRTGANNMPVVEIVQCPYFVTLLHQMNPRNGTRISLDTHGIQFHILTCIDGALSIAAGETAVDIHKGQTALIPADVGVYTLSGEGRALRSYQPA
jgi:mannose-6-phosphate isomerase